MRATQKTSIFDSVKPVLEPVTFFTRFARYTRFVLFTKLGLLLVVAVMVGYMVIKAVRSGGDDKYSLVFTNLEVGEAGTPKMVKPRLQGTDVRGRPYNVLGEYATQQSQTQISIHKVQGDMTLKDDSWVTILAETGDVDLTSAKLHMNGDVSLFHDSGVEFHTENVFVDMKSKTAYSDTSVVGQSLLGTLAADKFTVDSGQATIRFDGNVKVTIYAKAQDKKDIKKRR